MNGIMSRKLASLGIFLNQLQTRYHKREFLSSDPLEFVYQYTNPLDQEAVALLAAVLAYGNVKQIRRSVKDALTRMEHLAVSPSNFVRSLGSENSGNSKACAAAKQAFSTFVHRFNRGEDLLLLMRLLALSWEKHGSLGGHFLIYLEEASPTITDALTQLIAEWREWAGKDRPESFEYLLTSPADGSCCKRWCMFLRWMGRRDDLDPGLWTRGSLLEPTFPKGRSLKSHQLILPLDTHTGRISQYLGLTQRKTLNWKAALEITENLGLCDSSDPTRYDFALSRLGILDLCQRRYRQEICEQCQLVTVCKFASRKRNPAASRRVKV
jgi:uncharacterized protein (TIGR02757 family)